MQSIIVQDRGNIQYNLAAFKRLVKFITETRVSAEKLQNQYFKQMLMDNINSVANYILADEKQLSKNMVSNNNF